MPEPESRRQAAWRTLRGAEPWGCVPPTPMFPVDGRGVGPFVGLS